jgi:hypothetical protein
MWIMVQVLRLRKTEREQYACWIQSRSADHEDFCLLGCDVKYSFVYGLFNDAVNSSYCVVSNSTIISEKWMREYLEGSGSGLFWGNIPEFVWRDEINYERPMLIYILSRGGVTVDGVWVDDSIYWLLIHPLLVTTRYRLLTQTSVLSILQSPLTVSWQRILTQVL